MRLGGREERAGGAGEAEGVHRGHGGLVHCVAGERDRGGI